MSLQETNFQIDEWNSLQQPNHPLGNLDPSFRLLLSALDVGWTVKEPVFLRPRWSDNGSWVYHFILQRPPNNDIHMLTVSDSPEIVDFIKVEGFLTDKPRRL